MRTPGQPVQNRGELASCRRLGGYRPRLSRTLEINAKRTATRQPNMQVPQTSPKDRVGARIASAPNARSVTLLPYAPSMPASQSVP